MNNEIKKYSVTIAHENLTIVTDEQKIHIIEAASQVDSYMQDLLAKNIIPKKAALLTALKFAVDYLKVEQSNRQLEPFLNHLITTIDNNLSQPCE